MFLEFFDLQEQLLWQIRWLTGASLLLILGVFFFWIFRQKAYKIPALKFYDRYLGYYLLPYSNLQPEILNQSERIHRSLEQILMRWNEKRPNQFLAHLCWMEGQIYRYHQPHLRLLNAVEQEKVILDPTHEARLRLSIEHARVFFEKSHQFLQEIVASPEKTQEIFTYFEETPFHWNLAPLSLEQIQQFPEIWRKRWEDLFQEMQTLKPVITEHTLVGEWTLIVENASKRLQEKGLQCFYCSVKDFHTLAEAAHCHPFELKSFLESSV